MHSTELQKLDTFDRHHAVSVPSPSSGALKLKLAHIRPSLIRDCSVFIKFLNVVYFLTTFFTRVIFTWSGVRCFPITIWYSYTSELCGGELTGGGNWMTDRLASKIKPA